MLGKKKPKRAVQVSFVKTDENSAPAEDKLLRPETVALITEKTKEVTKVLAITVVGVYAAFKTIDTLSQIAIKKTKSADNEK
jgi:hypothetical protein